MEAILLRSQMLLVLVRSGSSLRSCITTKACPRIRGIARPEASQNDEIGQKCIRQATLRVLIHVYHSISWYKLYGREFKNRTEGITDVFVNSQTYTHTHHTSHTSHKTMNEQ